MTSEPSFNCLTATMTAAYVQIKFLSSIGHMFLSITKDLQHNKDVSPHCLTPCSGVILQPATLSPSQKILAVYGT